MEQTLARARRTGNEVAVAFIDLDSFKSINDSFGHEYGDYLLTQVADAMRRVVRASDTVSRLGGDEFVVVIEDYNNGARIGRVIERLFWLRRALLLDRRVRDLCDLELRRGGLPA